MSRDIKVLVQNYQGTFVLDLLNEFRKDVIRSIFRDIVLPPDAEGTSDQLFQNYSAGLKNFLTSPAKTWHSSYSTWSERTVLPPEASSLFSTLSSAVEAFLAACDGKTKHEVWAYLYSEKFSASLRVSPRSLEGLESDSPLNSKPGSIAGLFNIVALTIDDSRLIRLIQPPDILLNDSFHTLQACFPLLSGSELNSLAEKFRDKDYIHFSLEQLYGTTPPILRANTCVHYDTALYAKISGCEQVLEKSREIHNTGFLQIRPLADEQEPNPFGFFQLQCTLPGLMMRLIPPSCAVGRKSLAVSGNSVTVNNGETKAETGVFQIEFDDFWWDDERHPPYFLKRLRGLAAGWPRRIFNFLQLAKATASQLEHELVSRHEELERWKRRQVDEDVRELMDRLTLVSAVAHRVQLKIRPASSGIFSLHSQTQRLFVPKLALVADITWTNPAQPLSEDYTTITDNPPLALIWATQWDSESRKVSAVVVLPDSERDKTRGDYALMGMVGCHQLDNVGEAWPGLARAFFLVACASRNELLARLACGASESFEVIKLVLHRAHAPDLDPDGSQIGDAAQILAALLDTSFSHAPSKPAIKVGNQIVFEPRTGQAVDVLSNLSEIKGHRFVVKKRGLVEVFVALQQLIGEELVNHSDYIFAKEVSVDLSEQVRVRILLSGDFPVHKLHWNEAHADLHGLTGCILKLCDATGCPFPNAGPGIKIEGGFIEIVFQQLEEKI